MAQKSERDDAIVFWSSARIPRSAAEEAFAEVDRGHLVPKTDHFNALKRVVCQIAVTRNVADDGPVKPYGLRGHASAVGVEVRRFVRGATRNELPFLFSVGAVRQIDGSYQIKLLDCDTATAPQIARACRDVEAEAGEYWRQESEYLNANDLTQAITGLVKDCGGFLLRDEGVVWSIPIHALKPYETVADRLAIHGVQMVCGVCPPKINQRLVQHMADELVKRSLSVFNGLIEEMDDLNRRGGRPRRNGQQSRMEEWIAASDTLEQNKFLLGKAFSAISKAARVAREKIGEAALEAFA